MASSKQKQEMVQVDPTKTGSPFWTRRESPRPQAHRENPNSNRVIGASYSHTDVLKTSQHRSQRSLQTPRSVSKAQRGNLEHPILDAESLASPHSRRYIDIFSHSEGTWSGTPDNNNQDDVDEFACNDTEDEFGLPALTKSDYPGNVPHSQPRSRRIRGDSGMEGSPELVPSIGDSMRLRANSSDIAEERGLLVYPSTRPAGTKILRPQYKEILKDPVNALNLIDHSTQSSELTAHSVRISRINKFKRILQSSTVPLSDLRDLSWSGIPEEVRAMTWQLLLGYLPTNSERRVSTLERKRNEYLEGVREAFDRALSPSQPNQASTPSKVGGRRGLDEAIWHQISIDIPRTNPHIELYGYEATQRSLERILYVWAIRHPASGYVQGINDLVTPFWQVFLATYVTNFDIETGMDPGQLPKPVLDAVEADTFWCLTKLLDGIQDNYVYAQPGIHRQVNALHDLTRRIDSALAKHLEKEGVEFMQFSFRWMNCLLMREISIKNIIRMWDTYMAQEQGFSQFHLYVCAAFLVKWSDQLLKMDFQEIMMFLQALPTRHWTEKDIELLLSEAFIWQSLFQGSSAHLRSGHDTSTSTATHM
ncbi:hypothetical protein VTO42DRAFT_7006 [Malbranchea cinnamomea]